MCLKRSPAPIAETERLRYQSTKSYVIPKSSSQLYFPYQIYNVIPKQGWKSLANFCCAHLNPQQKVHPFRITGAPRARSKKDAASPGNPTGLVATTVTAQQVGPGSDEKRGRYAWMSKGTVFVRINPYHPWDDCIFT